jgi:uncharacterized tellurite resistance protein B-like protein
MKAANQNQNYQMGLLYFTHLLVTVDGYIDDREKAAIKNLLKEEQISEQVYSEFLKAIANRKEHEVYDQGVKLLSSCTEDEKLSALVHLYRLSQADNNVHVKEVRLILYSLKATKVSFEDVVLASNMLKAGDND